jgi:hypothetical protein
MAGTRLQAGRLVLLVLVLGLAALAGLQTAPATFLWHLMTIR